MELKETKKYSEKEKQVLTREIYKHTGKSIEPIERKTFYNGWMSFVYKYRDKEIEVFCFSGNKNKLINRVIKELKRKEIDKILDRL